jgi:hypothetical protein
MKCIHCGSDTKLKDRTTNGRRCAQCLHPFAFEPSTDTNKVSDGLFQRCIKDLSADDTLFFTEKQLYYELNRRLARKTPHIPKPFGIGASACMVGGVAGMIIHMPFLLPVGIVAGVVTLIVGANVGKKNPRPRQAAFSGEEFRSKYLNPYRTAHGAIEKLLPPIPTSKVVHTDAPPDLTSYSFDRALVTDHAEIAAMLVANRFHFENNCAILSLDGRYPANGRFNTILEMLKRNPNLVVFGIHDASIDGVRLTSNLRRDNWFPERNVRVADLGLRPLHVMKGGFILTTGPTTGLPSETAAQLKAEEITWLTQGNVGELASLRPARLMKAIYHGFNRFAEMQQSTTDYGPDGVIIVGDPTPGVWVESGGYSNDTFATDSFG